MEQKLLATVFVRLFVVFLDPTRYTVLGKKRKLQGCVKTKVSRCPKYLVEHCQYIGNMFFSIPMYVYVHSVSYVYAVLPFYDVKCLCSGGRE